MTRSQIMMLKARPGPAGCIAALAASVRARGPADCRALAAARCRGGQRGQCVFDHHDVDATRRRCRGPAGGGPGARQEVTVTVMPGRVRVPPSPSQAT